MNISFLTTTEYLPFYQLFLFFIIKNINYDIKLLNAKGTIHAVVFNALSPISMLNSKFGKDRNSLYV